MQSYQGPKIVSVDKKGEEPNYELSLSDSALPNAALEDIHGMGTSTASFKQSSIRRRAIQCLYVSKTSLSCGREVNSLYPEILVLLKIVAQSKTSGTYEVKFYNTTHGKGNNYPMNTSMVSGVRMYIGV